MGAPPTLCKKWKPQYGVENENFLHDFQGASTAYGIFTGGTHQFPSLHRHPSSSLPSYLSFLVRP
jgi:hypothetical protein